MGAEAFTLFSPKTSQGHVKAHLLRKEAVGGGRFDGGLLDEVHLRAWQQLLLNSKTKTASMMS